MESREHFCTCGDLKCKLHPRNHDRGCDPCIQKNLKRREIPSCFFRLVHDDLSGLKEFTIESFVKFYAETRKAE
jgi:hypothetical protein